MKLYNVNESILTWLCGGEPTKPRRKNILYNTLLFVFFVALIVAVTGIAILLIGGLGFALVNSYWAYPVASLFVSTCLVSLILE